MENLFSNHMTKCTINIEMHCRESLREDSIKETKVLFILLERKASKFNKTVFLKVYPWR